MTQVMAHTSQARQGFSAFAAPSPRENMRIPLGFAAPFGIHLDEDSLVEVALMGRPRGFWLENISGNDSPKQAASGELVLFEGLAQAFRDSARTRTKLQLQFKLDYEAARFAAHEPGTTLFKLKQSPTHGVPRSAKRKSLAIRRVQETDLPRPVYPAEVLYSCSPQHGQGSFLTDGTHLDMDVGLLNNLCLDAAQMWSSSAFFESLRERRLMRATRSYSGVDEFPFVSMRYGRQAISVN